MTTDNRTNELTAEQILVDEWIRQADRAKSMTGMDAIWFPDAEETLAVLRANGLLSEGTPSEARVEAAAKALRADEGFMAEVHSALEVSWSEYIARLVLVAAQGAAPQEPSGATDANGHSWMSWDESGKNGTYCRSCGGWAGKVGNRQCSPAPVLPSSGVDEDALRPFLKNLIFQYNQERVTLKTATRYLAEWLKEQGGDSRGDR